VQRGIWVPTQHLLFDEGKLRKTLIELAGRRKLTFLLVRSQHGPLERKSPKRSISAFRGPQKTPSL
jgi:hypothetical protein